MIVYNETDYDLEIFADGAKVGIAKATTTTIFSLWRGNHILEAKYEGEVVVEKEINITHDFDWTIHSEEYIEVEFW